MTGQPIIVELHGIGVTVVSRWIFNCYVIHDGGDGRPLVVDLGLPSQVESVLAVLHHHDLDPDSAVVVATHGHADHVGGLLALRERVVLPLHLPIGLRAAIETKTGRRSPGPRDVARILPVFADQSRDLGSLTDLARITGKIGVDARATRFPFTPDGWLTDGDAVPGAPSWRVLHTPGHTDDSTSLYDEERRVLISGDAVLSTGGRAWFNPELVDADHSAATEARLRPLAVSTLLPGHGRPVQGDVMARALGHRDRAPDSGVLRVLGRIVRSSQS